MVLLITHLKRKAGMTPEEFQQHWEHTHGPLVRQHMGKYIERYEQHPPLPGQEWDGIAIMTFSGPEKFDQFLKDPAYPKEIFPDEQRFLDHAGLAWQLVEGNGRVIIGGG
jgi:uncharacterized protein (DUF1330 family)